LHLSDWLLAKTQSKSISLDGKQAGTAKSEWTTIPLSAGPQTHTIEIH
jgi:hypothetical protein